MRRSSCSLLALCALSLAACDESSAAPTPGDSGTTTASLWVGATFEVTVDPESGEISFAVGRTELQEVQDDAMRTGESAAFCGVNIAQDDAASVALSGDRSSLGFSPAACGVSGLPYDVSGALCFDAIVTSGFDAPLRDVFAEVTRVMPETGYNGYAFPYGTSVDPLLIPDEPGAPTGTRGGLWAYGDLAPDERASMTWVFENAGGPVTIEGRILARFSESLNGVDDDCDGRVDEGLNAFDTGQPCVDAIDCASESCEGGVCVDAACGPGETTDGDGGCVDIDECAVDNGGCGHPDVVRCTDMPAGAAPICACDADSVRADLLEGIETIDVGGSLGSRLLPMSRSAFSVVTDASGDVLAAGAYFDEGRIFAIGHEGMMNQSAAGGTGLDVLVRNAATWLGGTGATVGVEAGFSDLRSNLADAGFDVVTVAPDALDGVDVFVGELWNDYNPTEINALRAFASSGGGLLLGGHAWYWSYTNDNPYENYPGNRLLRGTGLLVTTNTVDTGGYTLDAGDYHHAVCGLDALASGASTPAEQAAAAAVAGEAVAFVPWGDSYLTDAEGAVATAGDVVPTSADPVRTTEPFDRLAALIQMRRALDAPADEVVAHGSAADFPGAVPADAPRVDRTLTIDASFAGRDTRWSFAGAAQPAWRSTGLYAAAGEVVTVEIPARATSAGLEVQLGAHTDTLYDKDAWERLPEIVRRVPLAAQRTEAASGFGGLIYVLVPVGATLGDLEITIEGAVEAPHFVVGRDTDESWTRELRDRPAPFAELELDSLVLTVPSSAIRELDNPEALMTLWADTMDAIAELATVNPERERHERFVLDRQISAGLYHAGYPIMGHTYSVAELVDLDAILGGSSWGPFHEIGHNHQYEDWLLPGTVETTCNLYSVYVMEEVISRSRDLAHPAISPDSRASRVAEYLASPDFGSWSVWVALETYLQLQEEFGWELYTSLFEEYRELDDRDRPGNDSERIQQWIVRSSRAAGLDLTPFYAAWDFPIDGSTADAVSDLPAWTAHPMQ